MTGGNIAIHKQHERRNKQRGFTLVEIMFAISIFSLLVGAASSALISALGAYQRLVAVQNLSDNTQFALEYMARQMRLAKRSQGACTPAGTMYQLTGSTIKFTDQKNRCIEYSLSGEEISVVIDGGVPSSLTYSSMVRISSLSFIIRGALSSDSLQPLVTIHMRAQGVSSGTVQGPILSLQTSISARSLDTP
jgi:prepilin-type N-terminal cleavage/methylation domain-containing protein